MKKLYKLWDVNCEEFENDRQSDQEIDRRSLSDCITFIVLRDHDLIGDHIFPSDRDHENGDRPELCFFFIIAAKQ